MKTRMLILLILTAVGLNSCLVKSLHPYYTEKDLVFKPGMTGSWTDQDSASWTISQHMKSTGLFKPDTPDQAYDITYTNSKGTSRFIAHLFQLDGRLYLDFYPDEIETGNDLGNFHLIPAHSLARVDFTGDRISVRWYNEEWLVKLFNENRIRIPHERIPYDPDDPDRDHYQVVLTAPTDELQKFIRKYGDDPSAFPSEQKDNDYTFVLVKNKNR